jgi:glycosyltransferase involved in cell wall biosynthesis
MNPRSSRISVVITCHDQLQSVVLVLESLLSQSRVPDEVVIADDGSMQPVEALARRFGCGFVTTRPHTSNRGSRSLARQLGLLSTRGRFVIHLDGDIIPSRRALEFAVQFHDSHQTEAVVKVPRRFRIINGRCLHNRRCVRIGRTHPTTTSILSFHNFTSDCFSVHRELAREAGGWDPNFVGWGEEDVEFAYRLHLADVRMYAPIHAAFYATHVDHPVDHAANFRTLTDNAKYFAEKHPAILAQRSHLWRDKGLYLASYRMQDCAALNL